MSYYPLLILVQSIPPEVVAAVERTARNTDAEPWTYCAIFIASLSMLAGAVAAYYAFKTWRSQRQTERNTYRLEPEVQKNLFIEMCRHIYRNMVVSYAIKEKVVHEKYRAYPSEEHLEKMKVNLEDIHDEIFYKHEQEFLEISKLYMYLRNYNAELDIISRHLSSPDIDDGTKRRDIKTLLFKCDFLISKIFDFIVMVECAWPKMEENEVRGRITGLIEKDRRSREGSSVRGTKDSGPFDKYHTSGTNLTQKLYPDQLDEFLKDFNEDVHKEMGKNAEGGDIIHMIHFARLHRDDDTRGTKKG